MSVSVLGPLRVTSSSGVVEIRGAKERTLLAHLVAAGGQVVPVAALVTSLWGEDPPRSAAKSLQTYVLRLRNVLEPTRAGSPALLLTDGHGYRLAIAPTDVDAERFVRLTALGRRALGDGRAGAAADTLTEALAMWRGPAYAGLESNPFLQAECRRLEELRAAATEDRWAAELARGRAEGAVPELERLVGEHLLRERLWGLLILALYRVGRQGDALRAYERVRSVLADELGVDPGPELRALHARVLAQDPDLALPTRTSELPAALIAPEGELLGREVELAALRMSWERACAGQAVTVVVRAPRGGGTTRLAQALAAEVSRAGHAVHVVGGDGRSPSDRRTSAGDGDRPVLLVADRVPPPEPVPGTMVLALTEPDAPVPTSAEVLDLTPLTVEAVRAVAEQYVAAELAMDAAGEILLRTGGWPAAVHDEALRLARTTAAERVGLAATVADIARSSLGQARAEIADGVAALNAAVRPDGVTDPDGRTGPAECPWRGLASYEVSDAPWFSGRERLVAELVARLAGARLLAVVGASGSGKSSAVRAGLLASLAADVLPGSALWSQVLIRPGAHPMRTLARGALDRHGRPDIGDLLAQLVRPDGDDSRVVLVVDQLEEAWTACSDEAERAAFLDVLAELAEDPALPVTVVLVLRADYVGHLAEHPRLAAQVADSTVLVGSPTAAEVRRAVERPAQRGGLHLEDGLAEAIVSDAGSEPGLLPLLSTALTQLWEHRSGRDLTFAAYVGTGGLQGAIAHLAESAYTRLPGGEQAAARVLLVRLAGPGEGTAVTRRRVHLSELRGLPQPIPPAVVDSLVRARLLTVSDGYVEVAHEALFRQWPRLRSWLAEDAAGRAVQRRLASAASEWTAEGRDPTLLWRGARLASALDVAEARPEEITSTERAFLDAGRDAVDAERRAAEERADAAARQNRRLRASLTVVAVVLVAAMVAGVVAVRSRADAVEAREAAEAGRLAATAVNEERLDLALLSAVEAVRAEPGPETHGALLTLLSRVPDVVTQAHAMERFLRVAVSPDGGTVYLGENLPVVHALDAETGDPLWTVGTAAQPVALDVGPGGLLVAGPGEQGPSITLHEAATGEPVWTYGLDDAQAALGPDAVSQFAAGAKWLPDGRVVATTTTDLVLLGPDGTFDSAIGWGRQLEVETGVESLLVWPDGRVSVATTDGEGLLLDPARPDVPPVVLPGVVAAVSSAGAVLVRSPYSDVERADLSLYDAATLEPLAQAMPMRPSQVVATEFSPDGSLLAVGDGELLRLYDVASGREVGQYAGHHGTVMEAVFAGAARDLVWTAGRDGNAFAWDLSGERGALRRSPYPLASWRGEAASGASVAVALVLPAEDGWPQGAALHLVDTATGEDLGELEQPDVCPCNLLATDISADGSTAVAGLEVQAEQDPAPGAPYIHGDDYLAVYDVPGGRLRELVPVPWHTLGIGLTPDGTRAAVSGHTGYGVVDLVASEVVTSVEEAEEPYHEVTQSAEVSPDGVTAVVARSDRLLLLDMGTGETLAEYAAPAGDSSDGAMADFPRELTFAWTDDGEALAAGDGSGEVQFHDGRTLEPLAPARRVVGGWVLDLESSPDGRFVASMGTDGDVMLWDTGTWRPLGQPVTDEHGWGILAFDPHEPVLRSLHEDGTAVELSVDPDVWIRDACRIANRDLTADERETLLLPPADQGTCARLG